jgi:hypothetical protein
MAHKEPKRLKGIPLAAVYDAQSTQWELGQRDRKGKPVGEWKYWWPTTGHLCCKSYFEDGGRKETLTRFHPDGTISHQGTLLNGQVMPNTTYVLQRSKNKTTELALQIPEYKHVFRMEQFFIRKGLSLWKNFDEKGQRITLEGEPFFELVLTPKAYAKNFPGFEVPRELLALIEFQNEVGPENYSQGFSLGTDDKGLLKITSKKREFLSKLMFVADANGTGSDYYFWNDGIAKTLSDMPVVAFGDEGGQFVVAANLREFLSLVSFDVEASVTNEGVDFAKFEYEARPAIEPFRAWLKQHFGITPPRSANAIVQAAQKKHQARFERWMKHFVAE